MTGRDPLLTVDDLHVEFATSAGPVEALHGVSLTLAADETVAVVGESGSGKSVTALAMLQLLHGGRISAGRIVYDGREISSLSDRQMRMVRGREIGMIFQDPMTSLDPLYTIGSQLIEAIRLHQKMSKKAAADRAAELLDQVRLPDARQRLQSYPHQLSGGQRQRVMIAIALASSPRILIADEPTTALDVTVEAQILELIREIQSETRMAVMLITHDMGVVSEMADRVAVFYAGEVVEHGEAKDVLGDPSHPYTAQLLEGIPGPTTDRSQPLAAIPGAVPSLRELPAGCRFHPRCRAAYEPCSEGAVPLFSLERERAARCWLVAEQDIGSLDPVASRSEGDGGP